MSKMLRVSRKTLHKYTKFRVTIDENDESSCWDLIYREAYKDRMEEGIREKVIEYWDNHSCAIPYRKHVLWQLSGKGVYKDHFKHVIEMTGVALFEEFKESNIGVQISFTMFSKFKLWLIGLIWFGTLVFVDTMLNSSYTMTHLWIFAKNIGMVNQLLTQCGILFLWYYAIGILKNVFFIKRSVVGRRCHECGDLALFHRNFPIDPTHPGLSDITVKWKRYEYVSMNPSSSSHVPSKRIELLEDEIPISYFMEKFQS